MTWLKRPPEGLDHSPVVPPRYRHACPCLAHTARSARLLRGLLEHLGPCQGPQFAEPQGLLRLAPAHSVSASSQDRPSIPLDPSRGAFQVATTLAMDSVTWYDLTSWAAESLVPLIQRADRERHRLLFFTHSDPTSELNHLLQEPRDIYVSEEASTTC